MCLFGHPRAIVHPTTPQRVSVSHRFIFLHKPLGRDLRVEVRRRLDATKRERHRHVPSPAEAAGIVRRAKTANCALLTETVNVEPTPTSLRTSTVPPRDFTVSAVKASPTPVPSIVLPLVFSTR